MLGAFRVVQRNARVWRKFLFASLVGNLGQPLLFLLAMGYGLSRDIPVVEGLTYLQFIAPGFVASAVMYSAGFETTYGAYTRLTGQNTFQAILMTPVTVGEVALGEILWGALKGCISGCITLACLPLFGVWPTWTTILLLPVLFISGMLFSALGLIMSAMAKNYEFFNYFISLFLTPLFLFSGIFFSMASLPELPRFIFRALPLTPVVELARFLCYGMPEAPWVWQLFYLIVSTAASSWLAMLLLKRRLIK